MNAAERIFIADIEASDRHRAVDMARVETIRASIAELGLRTPITVLAERTGDDWTFRLVAGAHRLEAFRQLGEEFIEAFVMDSADDAELWEIDENFARAELTEAQRAIAHTRREELLFGKGVVRRSRGPEKVSTKSVKTPTYSEQAAGTLGVHANTVRRDLKRGRSIAPDVLAQIEGTDLDRGAILDDLAHTPRAEQAERLAAIRLDRSRVKMADDPLNDGEATERQLAALMAAWNRAGADARRRFLERVDTPVFDRGAA